MLCGGGSSRWQRGGGCVWVCSGRASRKSIRIAPGALTRRAVGGGGTAQNEAPPQETNAQRDARMKWWREARFGMFIHWGVSSVPAGTWNGKQIAGIGEWIMNRGKI